jgi:hypothetical protein
MDTAQTVLSQGNATQRVQAVTSTIPWIVLLVVAGLVVLVFLKGKKK